MNVAIGLARWLLGGSGWISSLPGLVGNSAPGLGGRSDPALPRAGSAGMTALAVLLIIRGRKSWILDTRRRNASGLLQWEPSGSNPEASGLWRRRRR